MLAVLLLALAAGAGIYYLQVYHFYEEIAVEDANVQLTGAVSGQPAPVMFENFKGIDANSSPIRYRACFDLRGIDPADYVPYPNAEPLVAPGWFDCFDAAAIGASLEAGEATALMGQENFEYGIDRIVAVMPDGRAWSWPQINACGETVFEGEQPPADCPPVPERLR